MPTRQQRPPQPDDFAAARRAFDDWRTTRKRGQRIPEPLWDAATALAEQHGIAKTAAALKLDYYALKRRLTGEPATPRSNRDDADARPRFVEVSLATAAATITCTLEVEGRGERHSKLRLELQGIALADLDALLRSVWSQSA